MNTAFGNTISEIIQFNEVGGATSKPIIRTEYFDDSLSTWCMFEDVESRIMSLSNENKRYQNYSFMPPAKTLELVLNNYNQVYSTGSGDPKASILKKNLLIRCWTGYELPATGTNSYTDDFSTSCKFVHMQATGGQVLSDITSYSGTTSKWAELIKYSDKNYDEDFLSAVGYYYKKYDFSSTAYDSVEKIEVSVSSDKFRLKYRINKMGWSGFKTLDSGSNIITVNSPADTRSIEIIVQCIGVEWGTDDSITSLKIFTKRKGYLFLRGTFITDEPNYSDKVKVSGRDYLKKALETNINLPSMSGVNIGTAISYVLDRCSIPYDVSKWDMTATVISVSGSLAESYLSDISGWQALDYLMDALNAGDDDWRLKWEADGKLSLKIIPTDIEADWCCHYFFNIEDINKNFDSDKQLQRITIMNKDIVPGQEQLLKTLSGTAISDSLYATYGTTALYVRYEDDEKAIQEESYRSNTAIQFAVSSGSHYTIRVYGCHPGNISTEKWSELGNADNIIKNNGSTYKRTNPFLDQGLADALADYMMGIYADPKKKIELSMVSNPYIELNDKLMVFDLFTYTDDIYIVNEIQESFNDPVLKDKLVLKEAGYNLGAFIWDRKEFGARFNLTNNINILKWDRGFVFDQDLEIGGEDESVYEKEIQFS